MTDTEKNVPHKKKLIAIIVLALIGFVDAIYLTYNAYIAKAQATVFGGGGLNGFVCDVNSTFSCSGVFNESFAWIFGIPFSGIAMVVYPVLAIVALLGLLQKTTKHFIILFLMALGGLVFNGYIIVNEYIVGAYCLLCLLCTAIIISIGVMSKIGMGKCLLKGHK